MNNCNITGVIYKIENKVNGKVYIGQTKVCFYHRKRAHLYELRSETKRNIKLQSAWNKYGEKNFIFSIIGEFPFSLLDKKEIYYIAKYDSFRNGYNMTVGGNQVMHDREHTIDAKRKMKFTAKNNWSKEEYRLSMMQRPVYKGSKAPRSTKVICINDQKVFGSMVEAGEYYGIGMERVSSVCTGASEYAGLEETGRKLQFDYYEEGKVYKLKNVNHVNEKRKVRCITTGEVFDSITDAGNKTGAPKASISHVCKGKRKRAGGLEWEYV